MSIGGYVLSAAPNISTGRFLTCDEGIRAKASRMVKNLKRIEKAWFPVS